jgi:hypothetical protein
MKRLSSIIGAVVCFVVFGASSAMTQDKEPPRARVSLYHVAPGRQVDFLKWLAAQDEVAKEAGLPVGQIYVHTDGDSWDYMGIAPVTTPEQDKKVEEIAKKKGLKTGFAVGLELRGLIASHTDTFTIGPTTAAQLVNEASKK